MGVGTELLRLRPRVRPRLRPRFSVRFESGKREAESAVCGCGCGESSPARAIYCRWRCICLPLLGKEGTSRAGAGIPVRVVCPSYFY